MTLAARPWYALGPHDASARLADQQLAGVWMWTLGGAVTIGAGLVCFASWLADASGDATDHEPVAAAPT